MLRDEALIRDIDMCRPRLGQCAFWWLGQMAFAVKTASKTLYFDLFLSELGGRLFPPAVAPQLVSNADFVFGSHDHADHIDDGAWRGVAAGSPQARFVLPRGLKRVVSGRLGISPDRMIGLAEGRAETIDGVTIQAVTAAHEQLNDREENEAFIVKADGVTVCHMGDTCLYDGLIRKLKDAGPIDILMLPINGRDARRLQRDCIGNMTYQEAVDLVGEVKPRLAVPGHYDMMEGNTENPFLFTSYLEIKYPERDFWVGPHARRVLFP